jgi:hypothetical protein
MRIVSLGLFALLAACSSGPHPPEITGFTYSPMQLAFGTAGTVMGQVGFRDPDGDCHLIAIGVVDPDGVLTEAAPVDTATEHLLFANVPFSFTITPTKHGTHQISVRFIDDTGLSTDPSRGAITVP